MKVGTDGTLLGAWASHPSPACILDIGTGSGLVALMLAQRFEAAQVIGIDIDADAATQAAENFSASPWSDRLTAQALSLQDFAQSNPSLRFQLIASNPPYFVDSLKNPDAGRRTARHTDTLSFQTLLRLSADMLTTDGVLALVLPADAEEQVSALAKELHLNKLRATRVCTKEGKPCKRVLLAFGKQEEECMEDVLCLMGADGAPRSPEYQHLTNDFYL